MDNTEIFLDKYKELENAAINLPDAGKFHINQNILIDGAVLPSWRSGVNSRISGLN